MLELRGGPVCRQQKPPWPFIMVIQRSTQHFRTKLGNKKVPRFIDRAYEQIMMMRGEDNDELRRGRSWAEERPSGAVVSEWHQVTVESVQELAETWHAVQERVREGATVKHGQNCSMSRSGLQVPLPAERGGFERPARSLCALQSTSSFWDKPRINPTRLT
jgi:hypothetical protein